MSKILRVRKSETSRKRPMMGSTAVASECWDACHAILIGVRSFDEDLNIQSRHYTLYQSHLPYSIGAFLLGSPEENQSEEDYCEKFLHHFKTINIRLRIFLDQFKARRTLMSHRSCHNFS